MERGYATSKPLGIQKWTIEGNKQDICKFVDMIEDYINNCDNDENLNFSFSIGLNSSLKFSLEIV